MLMQENFELRIREIGKLKDGWHFGSGSTFTENHVELAAQLANRYFKKYALTVSGTPLVNGAIELIFSVNDYFLDIEVNPNLKDATIKYSKGIDKNRTEENWGIIPISSFDEIFDKFIKLSST